MNRTGNACGKCGELGHQSRACDRRPVPHPNDTTALLVPLTRGLVATIDRSDGELVGRYRWHAIERFGIWYARTGGGGPGAIPTTGMHRLIMAPRAGLSVDHIDHDGLNNRRSNLRVCTQFGNMQNVRKTVSPRSSRYKGVHRRRGHGWGAIICVRGRAVHLGSFNSELEAAIAYDAAALKYFGEFACPNFATPGHPAALRAPLPEPPTPTTEKR